MGLPPLLLLLRLLLLLLLLLGVYCKGLVLVAGTLPKNTRLLRRKHAAPTFFAFRKQHSSQRARTRGTRSDGQSSGQKVLPPYFFEAGRLPRYNNLASFLLAD